ncbi:unnamed protein product [Fusarium graminearum]|nr:hypothetical protein FG05_35258 [Fusarium graminearum]CZS82979.1 unnamed protein product [Fusarium graminearum]
MSLKCTERIHENAIDILNSRRRPKRPSLAPGSNPQVAAVTSDLTRICGAKGNLDLRGTPSIVGMKQWLHRIGHSTADVDSLNIIHVAGTKGKESTCAFIESFLRAHGQRTGFPRKTGLYTSPHLILPEERIRICNR